MTTEHNDTTEPQLYVEELRDLDLREDESDAVRGGACQGPAMALGRGVIQPTQTQ